MQRWRNQSEASESAVARLGQLLRSESPLSQPSSRAARFGSHLAIERRAFVVRSRLAFALGIASIVVVASAASAMIGQAILKHQAEKRSAATHRLVAAHSAPAKSFSGDVPTPVENTKVEPSPAVPSPVALPRRARVLSSSASQSTIEPTIAPPVVADEESALVFRAFEALRRAHDAERAAALLDEHRLRFAGGQLEEEVLALRVEAAEVLGKPVLPLCDEYLENFPSGRYTQKILQTKNRNATKGFSPSPH